MSLWPRARIELPLADDPSGRFLSWVTAVMVFLATLALAGGLIVWDMAERWNSGLAGGLTIEVLPSIGAGAGAEAGGRGERVERALAIATATPGVRAATPLPAADLARLLEPWLGPGGAGDPSLPVPALIDVATDGPVDVAALAQRLASVPGAALDDHAVWLGQLRAFARAVVLAAFAVVGLVGASAMVAVVFAVRAGLAIHRHVVQLLHLMGATDRYVARQFERHVARRAFGGGLAGGGLAAATLIAIARGGAPLRAALLPELALGPGQWLACALVPVAVGGLAVATARWTVLRTLESMP